MVGHLINVKKIWKKTSKGIAKTYGVGSQNNKIINGISLPLARIAG